ncbi:MAG: hypothetical protein IKQ31_02440 [Clostridia bacterium]|nr:hypothetical protein [Clostridia bacterium]
MTEKVIKKVKKFDPTYSYLDSSLTENEAAVREAIIRAIITTRELQERVKFHEKLREELKKAGVIKHDQNSDAKEEEKIK